MNFSKAIFLVKNNVRAIKVSYEPSDKNGYVFKSFDASIKVDDFVVIPTDSRHNMTVAKVVAVDVDVDFDDNVQLKWVITKVDKDSYEHVLKQEQQILETIRAAERKKKQEELKATIFANTPEMLALSGSLNTAPEAIDVTPAPETFDGIPY